MKSLPVALHIEPNAANHLAWMNAILGLQRTLMAAERTAVTLIAFGFTVAQIFQNMESRVPREYLGLGPSVPRNLGLLMIASGVSTLALFTWQYLRAIAYLGAEPFSAIALPRNKSLHRLTCMTSYAIMALGALGFGALLVSA